MTQRLSKVPLNVACRRASYTSTSTGGKDMGIGIVMPVAEIKIAAIKIVPEDSTKTLSKK